MGGRGGSAYTQRPDDPEAFYFTPENYGFKADGKSDVTDALQEAINREARKEFWDTVSAGRKLSH